MADKVEVKIVSTGDEAKSSMEETARSIDTSLKKMSESLAAFGQKSQQTHAEVKKHTDGLAAMFAGLHENIRVRFGSINSVFEQFSSKLAIFGAAFAGGALFKGAIESMIRLRDEVHGLQTVFGMSAEKATALSVQLKLAGVSAETFETMAFRVGRMLKTQSEEFDRLKIKTRDASGALLPMDQILQNVYRRMLDFKAGTDQDMFAMATAGRNAKDFASDMEALNSVTIRAAKLQRDLGIEMGEERQAQIKRYKTELNATKLVFEEMGVRIGEAVLPRLQNLSAWFVDTGPRAIQYIVDAVKIFVTVLEFLGSLVAAVAVKATAGFKEIGISAKANAAIAMAAITQNWSAIPGIVAKANADIVANNAVSSESVADIWKKAADKVKALWADIGVATGSASGRSAEDRGAGARKGKGTEDFTIVAKGAATQLELWRNELERIKDAQGLFNEFSKAQEVDFWNQKLALVKKGSKEYIEVYHLMHEAARASAHEQFADAIANLKLEIDEAKKNKDRQMQLAQELVDFVRSKYKEESKEVAAALREQTRLRQEWERKEEEIAKIHTAMIEAHFTHQMELARLGAEQELALGLITVQQKLVMEEGFENQMYASKLAQLQKERALHADDAKFVAEMDKQILAVEDAHQAAMTKLANAAVLDREKYALEANKLVESSFSTLFADLANHVKTVKQAFLDFFKLLSEGLTKIASNKLAEQLFGPGTAGGGFIGGLTSKIFGGGAAVAATPQTLATNANTTAIGLLTDAVDANTAALGSASFSSGGGLLGAGGGGFGSLFGEGGILSFDVGTPYVPRDTLAMVHRGEAIIPAAANKPGMAGHSFNVTNIINGPVDTRTLDQIAAATARGVRRVQRNL